jgi:hypothetical protein
VSGRTAAVVAIIGGAVLAYQVVLVRVFSIAQGHHFASMAIGVAMLGFGAAGVALALLRGRTMGREGFLLYAASLGFAASVALSFTASQWIPFDIYQLVALRRQLLFLLADYLALAVPFFFASAAVTAALLLPGARAGPIYFANMTGSGAGAALAVVLLNTWAAERAPYAIAALAGAAPLLSARWLRPGRRWVGAAVAVAAIGLACAARAPLRISEFKPLAYALEYPDARIVAESHSSISRIAAVRSRMIRETPGQISGYSFAKQGPLPEQIGLFFDAGSVSAVNRFDGDFSRVAYLDYVTPALPYHLVRGPRVLVVGAGGGSDVLMALSLGASEVTAVDVDPAVFRMVDHELGDFAGGIYRRGDVRTVVADGRRFLDAGADRYDVIQISLFDSFTAAAAGVQALNESYLYTVEAMRAAIARLSPNGVLAVTRWLKTPPRDAVKMFATLVEACRASGLGDPSRHLAFIRSWNTGTIVLSRSPLEGARVEAVRDFCQSRGFDLCYCPGVQPDEVNRFTVMERPVHYEAALALLGDERGNFYRSYLFDVRPATDDRPYFFQFFRWRSLPRLVAGMGTEWIPFVEWGYLALVATLIQGVLLAGLLLFPPLFFGAAALRAVARRGAVLGYFAALGLGYMLLEFAFIQRVMLFLGHPVYAVAVVLSSFLVFSGLGSLWADRSRFPPVGRVAMAVAGLAVATLAWLVASEPFFRLLAPWPDPLRVAVSVALLAPAAFCMGVPFPVGLQWAMDRGGALLPWVWAVNGFASVIGASGATLLQIHFGFRATSVAAIAVYTLAVMALRAFAASGQVSSNR